VAEDYDRMRRLLVVHSAVQGIVSGSETDPVRHLDAMAMNSPATARKGLRMAIGDIVEMLARAPTDDISALEHRLREADAMSIAEARLLFSRRFKAVVKRGTITGDDDYYLVRNAVEAAPEDEQAALWKLLADYETRAQ
jgi:hypothetical protein